MKLVTFRDGQRLQLGVVTEKGILDVAKALKHHPNREVPATIEQVITAGQIQITKLAEYVHEVLDSGALEYFRNEDQLNLGPCVPNPGKIICIGLNYRKHAEETHMPIPEYPIIFNKFNNAIAAPQDIVNIPYQSEQMDYEAELVIVMGKEANQVNKEDALSYVLGYCNGNDLSARDLQFRTNQWLLGKTSDGFCPIGPYLVTADEVENPNGLEIKAYVNGEIRQNSHTSDMIFYCDELISYLSYYMTLNPGDIILTGTPEGVAMGYPQGSQPWLKEGDEVTIEIAQLGSLTNRIGKKT